MPVSYVNQHLSFHEKRKKQRKADLKNHGSYVAYGNFT